MENMYFTSEGERCSLNDISSLVSFNEKLEAGMQTFQNGKLWRVLKTFNTQHGAFWAGQFDPAKLENKRLVVVEEIDLLAAQTE